MGEGGWIVVIALCILVYFLIGVIVAAVCDVLGLYLDHPRVGTDPNRPLTIVFWPVVVLILLPLVLLSLTSRYIASKGHRYIASKVRKP